MIKFRSLISATAVFAVLSGCTVNPYTGESQAGKSGIYGLSLIHI